MSGWRPLLRIARRDALRARGRSLLVTAMIALPVLGMTAIDVTARSAQLGAPTAPKGFDPVVGTGVIHERRHSLTWAISPDVSWMVTRAAPSG